MCVGGLKPSAEQLRKVGAFVREAGDALLELRLFPNLDTTSDEDLPSGMIAVMRPDATVNAALVSDQLFEGVAAVKVATPNLKEKQLLAKSKLLQEAVQQQPAESERFTGEVRSLKTNKDVRAWAPELGGPGSFLGIYSQLKEDHRNKEFWIVGRSTVPAYVQDVKQALVAEQPTYRQLVNDDAWRRRLSFGVHGADRNLGRMLANAAEACGVEVTRTDEVSAHLADVNHLAPEIAVPDVMQHTHTIQTVSLRNKPAVALTYGVIPAGECYGDRVWVVGNPYDGIVGFPLVDQTKVTQAMGMPCDTGRKTPAASIPLDVQHYHGRLQGVIWEGSSNNAIGSAAVHPDLHPQAFHSIASSSAFHGAMRELGWNATHREQRLVPVTLKIWKQ